MNVASAARLRLIRQETGIEEPEPVAAVEPARPVPTLRQYQQIFDNLPTFADRSAQLVTADS